MNNNERPSFGTSKESNVDFEKLTETRSQRKEVGASWAKVSRSGMNYYTTKLTFTKQELQELLDSSTGDVVELRLVSFPNANQDNNPRRPSYRLYKEINEV
jgi:uncharacterized protein (DUF736 family)